MAPDVRVSVGRCLAVEIHHQLIFLVVVAGLFVVWGGSEGGPVMDFTWKLRPAVSILMPNFNKVEWIAGSISSVLNQTMRKIELVILDDQSTDGSFDIISSPI